MKFLIDQNLPVGLLDVLEGLGHEALHVKHLNLSTATDHRIWEMAVSLGAVIVSKDSDFIGFAAWGSWNGSGQVADRQLRQYDPLRHCTPWLGERRRPIGSGRSCR